MAKFRVLVVAVVLGGLLTSCGALLGQFIGEQPVENALGLGGSTVVASKVGESELPDYATAAFAPEQTIVTEFFVGGGATTFDDVDWDAIQAEAPVALPFPNSYSEQIGISSTLTVGSATPDALPDTLTITGMILNLVVSDASEGNPTVEHTVGAEGNADVTFTKGDCDADSCSYSATSAELEALLELFIGGATFDEFWSIVINEVNPNTLDAGFVLFVDSEGTPGDTIIQFTVSSEQGTLDFR